MWRHCIWQEYIITSNQANQACSMNPLADPFRGSLCPFSCARFSTGAASAAAAAAGAGASAAEDAMEGSTRRQTGEVCEDVTCSQRYWKNWDDMYVYIIYIYMLLLLLLSLLFILNVIIVMFIIIVIIMTTIMFIMLL